MKKIISILLTFCMMFSLVACSSGDDTQQDTASFTTGAYAGNAEFSQGDFKMSWVFAIDFEEDGTFAIINDSGEEKGSGTYTVEGTAGTMTFAEDKTCSFTVKEDGTVEITSDLPYGKASITPETVGGIVLSHVGDEPAFEAKTDDTAVTGGDYAVAAGTYSAVYVKESAMAGTVEYKYNAEIGAEGTFKYNVTFEMKGEVYDGSSAEGTYTLENGKFVFTDSEGTVTEGAVTAENTLVISLFASQMASEPYEVTFTLAQ